MRCLVVGGTGFLGGAITDALVAEGHSVATLTRGETDRELTPNLDLIHADRYGDLSALKGRAFDWVFDSCAYSPDAVETLLTAVGDNISRYVMISSISAYGEFTQRNLDETAVAPDATAEDFDVAASLPPEDRTSAFAYGASYGPLKRACEIKAEEMLGDRATALRVGLLVGAGDYTDRLTWWVRRIDEAVGPRRKVPAPAPKTRPLQLIDVRDVAEFALRCAEDEMPGIWNVTSPPQPFSDVLNAILDVSDSGAELVWVEEDAFVDADITPWVDVPMMAPVKPAFRYFLEVSTTKARTAGLTCRPIEDTLTRLLEWDRDRRHIALQGGMTAQQEALLLG